MTRVKICGLTRREDVALAGAIGAFAVGFNFSSESPRRVTPAAARVLAEAAPAGVLRVGVFVSEPAAVVREAVGAARLDLVQLHRPLRSGDLNGAAAPVLAVVHVGEVAPDLPAPELLSRCEAVLFDTRHSLGAGGTGAVFDWSLVASLRVHPRVVLAGGLTPANVGEAVRRVRPWAVDVASGVESAPGVKDEDRMRRFFEAVRDADAA